jgi:hypothetical protein
MVSGVGSNYGGGGSSSTVRQAPEVYSPLFQMANLQLPRDRITMNAWNRNFYITHPLVHNCINLHATYPISKINIKCKDAKIEQFFNDMAEDIDLIGTLQSIALQYWTLGETFVYAQLDEKTGRWKEISLLNPDYIHVKKSPLGGFSLSMRPDAALLKLIQSSNPDDLRLVSQMDPEIVYHMRKGNNIPLDNFHVSHLKMQADPSDIHGTSIIVGIYKDLMLYDKLRECYSEDTEVLTNQGFKKYHEVIEMVNGIPKTKNDIKIACPNSKTDEMEFHIPTNVSLSDYTGKMRHFSGKKVDILVTLNHRMWESRKLSNGWSDWEFKLAKDFSPGTRYRFKSTAKWSGTNKESVEVCGHQVPIKLYLKVLGYIISEGCVHSSEYTHTVNNKKYNHYGVSIYQKATSDCFEDMFQSFEEFAKIIEKHVCHTVNSNSDVHSWGITGKDIVDYFRTEIGDNNGACLSINKHIPRWVLGLNKELLSVLLRSLLFGDGSDIKYKNKTGFKYYTISTQLADDVCELVFKCGFAPIKYIGKHTSKHPLYCVGWSETNNGIFPNIYGNDKHKCANITDIDYSGKIWCFEVPTGLFVTRRNGRIAIQGNSKFAQADNLVNPITLIKVGGTAEGEFHATSEDLENYRQIFEAATFDKDFKIITHAGVTVERVGASGAIIDIAPDMAFILDNICFGLMVPKNILVQEGAAFQSATIGLEVLKQRYESFRNMMERWLIRKIFAPISELQEFYSYKDGEKKLIVPSVEWNALALYDVDSYINVIKDLANNPQNPVVSKTTLFHSLGLNMEDENRRIKEEAINTVILQKELAILQTMSLGALRSLEGGKSDIIEPTEPLGSPLPGTVSEESGMPGGLSEMGGSELGGGLAMPTPPNAPAESMPVVPPIPATTTGPAPKA